MDQKQDERKEIWHVEGSQELEPGELPACEFCKQSPPDVKLYETGMLGVNCCGAADCCQRYITEYCDEWVSYLEGDNDV